MDSNWQVNLQTVFDFFISCSLSASAHFFFRFCNRLVFLEKYHIIYWRPRWNFLLMIAWFCYEEFTGTWRARFFFLCNSGLIKFLSKLTTNCSDHLGKNNEKKIQSTTSSISYSNCSLENLYRYLGACTNSFVYALWLSVYVLKWSFIFHLVRLNTHETYLTSNACDSQLLLYNNTPWIALNYMFRLFTCLLWH